MLSWMLCAKDDRDMRLGLFRLTALSQFTLDA